MCVIIASENTPIPEDHIRAGWKENPWGGGVAWIEADSKGKLEVRFKKGISNVEDLVKLVGTLSPPYVVHMRIPTEGLDDIELTHPFLIDAEATSVWEGTTKSTLLFHNGKWDDWKKESWITANQRGLKLPSNGLLNDSRMMAWHAFHVGETILQLIDRKALVFGLEPDGKTVRFQLYGPRLDKSSHDERIKHGWNFKGDETTAVGVHYSNDKWEKHLEKPRVEPIHKPIASIRDIQRSISGHGGDRNPDKNFQPGGQLGPRGGVLPGREPKQEQVEGRAEAAQARAEPDGRLINDPSLRRRFAAVHNDDPWALENALRINPANLTRRVIGYLAETKPKGLVH